MLLGLSAGACKPAEPVADHPNIILISADTLRADRLGMYGYAKPTSPWLDSLAAESVLFSGAYSQANVTNPSHASILTSLYVSTHGILDNKGYELSPVAETMAEILSGAGYQTAGFSSVYHLNLDLNGLDQGFDFHSRARGISSASQTNQRVRKWLSGRRDRRPLFLFIHYFDTHTPYTPPSENVAAFYEGDPRDPSNKSMEEVALQPDQIASFEDWLSGITDRDYVKALYDGAVNYLDDQLRRLSDDLKQRGLWDNSIIVFTADHGESLDEHGIYFSHLGLYEPSVKIPLLIRIPEKPPQVVAGQVQSIDILPTLLGAIGVEAPASLEGVDLGPWMDPDSETLDLANLLDRPIYQEHAHAAVVALRRGAWKYLFPVNPYNQLPRKEELYNLETDPGEEVNLAESEPVRARQMQEALQKWFLGRQLNALSPKTSRPSLELIERLRSLGYVE